MGKFQFSSSKPSQKENEIGLDRQGNGDEQDDQRIVHDIGTLKCKQQHQGQQKCNDADRFEFWKEFLLEPDFSLAFDQCLARDHSSNQGHDYKNQNTGDQGIIGNCDVCDPFSGCSFYYTRILVNSQWNASRNKPFAMAKVKTNPAST